MPEQTAASRVMIECESSVLSLASRCHKLRAEVPIGMVRGENGDLNIPALDCHSPDKNQAGEGVNSRRPPSENHSRRSGGLRELQSQRLEDAVPGSDCRLCLHQQEALAGPSGLLSFRSRHPHPAHSLPMGIHGLWKVS